MKYKVGDEVIILHSHSDDIGKTGVITCVRPSFCKIMIEGREKNHCYGQFKKVLINKEEMIMDNFNDPKNIRII